MKKSNIFFGKALSIVCTIALLCSVLFIPYTVNASAEEKSHEYFYSDFSSADATAYNAWDSSEDEDGNVFYPVKFNSTSSDKTANVKTELVTLSDENGKEHSLLKVTASSDTTNAKEVHVIITDKDGKPFIMDANSSYKIDYKIYVQSQPEGNAFSVGGGVPSKIRTFGSPDDGSADVVFGVRKNYAWSMQYNKVFGVVTNTGLLGGAGASVNAGYGEETGIFTLKDAAYFLKYGYKIQNDDETWYAKKSEGSVTVKTENEKRINNEYFLTSNELQAGKDGYHQLGIQSYLTVATSAGSSADMPLVYYIDYIRVTKQLSASFDANGGTLNGEETGSFGFVAGEKLPTPQNNDTSLKFGGWYLDEGLTVSAGKEGTLEIAGKTLYAKWVDAAAVTHDSFYSDFSSDDATAYSAWESSADEDGNTFYPVKFNSTSGNKNAYVKTELVTLPDENGEEHSLLKVTAESDTTNVSELNLIITDKYGNPFIMDANSSYKIDYKIYVQSQPEGNAFAIGGGVASKIRTFGSPEDGSKDTVFGVRKNYAWSMKDNPSFGVTTNTGLLGSAGASVNAGYGEETGIFTLKDAAYFLKYGYKFDNGEDAWYAKSAEGSVTVKTEGEKRVNNEYMLTSNTLQDGKEGYHQLGVQSYLGVYASSCSVTDEPFVFYIDYISVQKQLSASFDANGGTLNGEAAGELYFTPDGVLPTPFNADEKLSFDGWYLDKQLTQFAGVNGSTALAGKTLYAKWTNKGQFVYDFDHNEIFRSGESEKLADRRTVNYGGKEYYVYSWSFPKERTSGVGLGKDGTTGLWVGGFGDDYTKSGGYLLNNGASLCELEANSMYKVEMDVNVKSLNGKLSASLGYNFYYDSANGCWSESKNGYAKYHTGNIVSKIDTGELDGDNNPVYSTEQYNYEDENGETASADIGKWVHLTYYFKTPAEFDEATDTRPAPNALGIDMSVSKGSEIVFDNIVVEKSKVTLDAGNGGTVKFNGGYYGEELVLPIPENTDKSLNFMGWFDNGGNKVTSITVGTENLKYIAAWVGDPGKITFNNDDNSFIDEFTGNVGDEVIFPDTPVSAINAEYVFIGWFNSDGTKVTKLILGDKNITLTAKYSIPGAVVYGDVTGDSNVDATDLVRLKKYLAGQKVEINAANSDCTGDGNVDATDLVRLKKFLAGQHVVLGPDK